MSALVPVLGVVPLAVVVVVVVLVVDDVPVVVPVLLVFVVAAVVVVVLVVIVVVSDETVAAAVGAKPAPANVIAAIIVHSCFVRVSMDGLLSLRNGSPGPNELLGLQNDLGGRRAVAD